MFDMKFPKKFNSKNELLTNLNNSERFDQNVENEINDGDESRLLSFIRVNFRNFLNKLEMIDNNQQISNHDDDDDEEIKTILNFARKELQSISETPTSIWSHPNWIKLINRLKNQSLLPSSKQMESNLFARQYLSKKSSPTSNLFLDRSFGVVPSSYASSYSLSPLKPLDRRMISQNRFNPREKDHTIAFDFRGFDNEWRSNLGIFSPQNLERDPLSRANNGKVEDFDRFSSKNLQNANERKKISMKSRQQSLTSPQRSKQKQSKNFNRNTKNPNSMYHNNNNNNNDNDNFNHKQNQINQDIDRRFWLRNIGQPQIYGVANSRRQRHTWSDATNNNHNNNNNNNNNNKNNNNYNRNLFNSNFDSDSEEANEQRENLSDRSKSFDTPQIECPSSENGMDRFSCPSRDNYGRFLCIDDQHICDGYFDCPLGEDEERINCMFYKSNWA
ncbi:hypothetical protein SSS_03166 [Sarcoptes scabiei]|uniref:Uncharacterized protein n=1 Tax=Sarcoptes scabiei TaxID=52283 RepID=A0A834RGW5_SARSC|nr:hypothetical protein SSS_03166 [Sarcoptes scabiei]